MAILRVSMLTTAGLTFSTMSATMLVVSGIALTAEATPPTRETSKITVQSLIAWFFNPHS